MEASLGKEETMPTESRSQEKQESGMYSGFDHSHATKQSLALTMSVPEISRLKKSEGHHLKSRGEAALTPAH